MSDKQIFAALDVADHEIRLIVGEFFNTRFNIIKVERIPCFGLGFDRVIDSDKITEALTSAKENVQRMIGTDIRKVILSIPSYRLKKYTVHSTVDIEGIDGVVTVQDIRKAIHEAESANIGKEYALIQTVCVKYTMNGISTRRIPIGERCSQLSIDIDLLCADRKMAYDLVMAVEKSGLQVLDIFPDVYAIAKEAALFEQAVNRQVIILKMQRESTTLGLIRKGRIVTAALLPAGLGTIAADVVDQYGISSRTAVELIQYSAHLNQEKCSHNPVHIWSDANGTHTISEQELVDCVRPTVEQWLEAVTKTCQPILQAGETTVIITDEGGETDGLAELLHEKLGCEVKCYIPETLGGRNAELTTGLGLFYSYQDKMPINGYVDDSLDMDAFTKAVSYRNKKTENETKDDTLTRKLKGLFLEGKTK